MHQQSFESYFYKNTVASGATSPHSGMVMRDRFLPLSLGLLSCPAQWRVLIHVGTQLLQRMCLMINWITCEHLCLGKNLHPGYAEGVFLG